MLLGTLVEPEPEPEPEPDSSLFMISAILSFIVLSVISFIEVGFDGFSI